MNNMTYNNVTKKGLTFGIIFLFLMIGFSPICNAHDTAILSNVSHAPQTGVSVPITILEYKADGTVERTVVRMSPEQADGFHEEMRNAQDLDTRLSVYKKYNLISQDITVDTLQAGMQEKAQRIGLTQEKLEHMIKSNRTLFNPLYIDIYCKTDGYSEGGYLFLLSFGTSLITRFLNGRDPRFNSFDVVDHIIGHLEFFESNGELGSVHCRIFFGAIKMVGFVGYVSFFFDEWMNLMKEFDGFAVYIRAIGTLS